MKIIQPKICPTLKLRGNMNNYNNIDNNIENDVHISEFGGLPVANGFTIHSAFRENINCTVM